MTGLMMIHIKRPFNHAQIDVHRILDRLKRVGIVESTMKEASAFCLWDENTIARETKKYIENSIYFIIFIYSFPYSKTV